jgi:hypothetical protein
MNNVQSMISTGFIEKKLHRAGKADAKHIESAASDWDIVPPPSVRAILAESNTVIAPESPDKNLSPIIVSPNIQEPTRVNTATKGGWSTYPKSKCLLHAK